MNDYLRTRSKEHLVTHDFSGKSHFFTVHSDSGEKYSVAIQASCDCRYHSVQGAAKGNLCSHLLAVLKHLSESKLDHTFEELTQRKRNECLKLVRRSNRVINKVRVSDGESKAHQEKKILVCKELEEAGKFFVTEAIFLSGGRADILVLDDFKVIEIAVSESDESLARKALSYPKGLEIEIVKVKQ